MTKIKTSFLIEASIVIGLVIGLPFAFDNSFSNDAGALTMYIVSKCVFGLLFLIAFLFAILKKSHTFSRGVIMIYSALVQLLPLAIRYIVAPGLNTPRIVWPIVIMAVSAVIFIFLIFGLSQSDELFAKSNKESESPTIEIHERKTMSSKFEEND